MNDYIAAILFFLPAGVSNMSPVLANRLPIIKKWETPVDFGRTWRGKRLLGNNKRWRGVICGTILGGLTAVVVSKLNANTVVTIAPFWAGAILGFGALAGDAVESFFKRRVGVTPGNSWFPFDQTDYIVGGLIAIYPFVQLPGWVITTVFVVYFGLHLLVAYFGYLLGLKDKPI
jgi:CDP-2,3-bis-(O-geranylgeranyl)-sn-glycerol synthase